MDHGVIILACICEMLNITINVLSTLNPTMTPIVSSNGISSGNVYIGLVEQYYYVALEAITDTTDNSVEKVPDTNESVDNSTKDLSDDVIEQSDEHTRQITGGPLESMLSHENPLADAHYVYSVAPAEGQTPIFIMNNIHFEEMFNPNKFCFGIGGFHT